MCFKTINNHFYCYSKLNSFTYFSIYIYLYNFSVNIKLFSNGSFYFRYLVEQGCIPPLCELLTLMDAKIVQVALNGLENILRLGEQEAKATGGVNSYAVLIEGCYGNSSVSFFCINYHLIMKTC